MANVKVFNFVLNTGDFPKNSSGSFSFTTLNNMVHNKNYVGGDFTIRTNLGSDTAEGRLTAVRTYKKGVAGYTTNTVEFELWLENALIGTVKIPYSDITTNVVKNKYKTTKIKIGQLLTDWQDKLKEKRQQQHKEQQQKATEEQGIKDLIRRIKELEFELNKTKDDLQNAMDDVQIEKDRAAKALAKIKNEIEVRHEDSLRAIEILIACRDRRRTRMEALAMLSRKNLVHCTDELDKFYPQSNN